MSVNQGSRRAMSFSPIPFAVALAAVSLFGGRIRAQDFPRARPEEVGFSSARLERIGPAMQRYIDRGEIAGVVTLVSRRGRVVHYEARGLSEVATRRPMETDAIFRIASMTKPITSVALMMLYEEGHFLLTDPISKFLPEFADMKVAVASPNDERVATPWKLVPADPPINFRHVLTHTAGLPNSYRGLTRGELLAISPKASEDETIGDFVERLAKLPLNFQPGQAWEYSRATDVVGRLVEVISGQTLDEFFQQRIFAPLRMTDTHFYLPREKAGRFTAQYSPGAEGKIQLVDAPNEESRWIKEPHVYFMGAGGLVSTVSDHWRFQQMMLNGGKLDGVRLLGRKTVELMTGNHTGDLDIWLSGPGTGFGLGYGVVTDMHESAQPWSTGSYYWGGAFCTWSWVDPAEEMVGILMTQVRPYDHINIRQEFTVLACQALEDDAPSRGRGRRVSGVGTDVPLDGDSFIVRDESGNPTGVVNFGEAVRRLEEFLDQNVR